MEKVNTPFCLNQLIVFYNKKNNIKTSINDWLLLKKIKDKNGIIYRKFKNITTNTLFAIIYNPENNELKIKEYKSEDFVKDLDDYVDEIMNEILKENNINYSLIEENLKKLSLVYFNGIRNVLEGYSDNKEIANILNKETIKRNYE